MKPCKIWPKQCDATKTIEAEFGMDQALDYLIGEKFINFLEAAETDAEFRIVRRRLIVQTPEADRRYDRKPASQPRTQAIKHSNGVQSPRCFCKLKSRY